MAANERRRTSASDGDSDATHMSDSDNDGASDSSEAELLIEPPINAVVHQQALQAQTVVNLAGEDDSSDSQPSDAENDPFEPISGIEQSHMTARPPAASSGSDSDSSTTPRRRRKRLRQESTVSTTHTAKPAKPTVVIKPQPTECTVCYDPCTIAGRHRLVSLKCGHVFGKKCIDRWVAERRTCPNCSASVRKADIRPLFTDHVAVVDNSGLEDMAHKFEAEKSRRIQLETDLSRIQLQLQLAQHETNSLKEEATRWRRQVADLQCRIASERFKADADAAPSQLPPPSQYSIVSQPAKPEASQSSLSGVLPYPSQSTPERQAAVAPSPSSQQPSSFRELFRYTLQSSRVCTISPSCGVLCVGEEFNPTSHGIIKLSTADTRHAVRIAVHQSAVRDLAMSTHDDLALSVAFDGKLCVSNLRSDSVVMRYALPTNKRNSWSCSFSHVDPFAMFCGFQDGTIARYDMRRPTQDGTPLSLYEMPMRQPVHAIQLCPTMGGGDEQLIAASFAGFGVWASTAMTQPAVEFTAAPGCCSLASCQTKRSRLLVTTRPQSAATTASHTLYDLPPSIVGTSVPVLRTRLSGFRTPSVISRSAVWSTHDGHAMVASWDDESRTVNVWDESTQQVLTRLPSPVLGGGQIAPVVDVKHAVSSSQWQRGSRALLSVLSPRLLVLYNDAT